MISAKEARRRHLGCARAVMIILIPMLVFWGVVLYLVCAGVKP